MGDQFEKYIKENKAAFDEEPDKEKMWEAIDKKLDRKQQGSLQWIWKAAAVVFLVSTSLLLVDRFRGEQPQQIVSTEFIQVEKYYSSLIAEKKSEITSYDDSLLVNDFLAEIERLDQMYAGLKSTFKKKTGDEKLTNAMILNLQLRLDILEQQLKILEQLNETEHENDADLEI